MGGTPSLGCPWPPALPDHDEDDEDDDDDYHKDDNDDDTPSFSTGYCRVGYLIKLPAKPCFPGEGLSGTEEPTLTSCGTYGSA